LFESRLALKDPGLTENTKQISQQLLHKFENIQFRNPIISGSIVVFYSEVLQENNSKCRKAQTKTAG
jgi:hypothetical protein